MEMASRSNVKGNSKATEWNFFLNISLFRKKTAMRKFGDSPNDLPMLKAAGVSVAMEFLRGIEKDCTYQTSAVDKDGIYNALEHLSLI